MQVFSGWVEIEQRVWLRLKWIRQFAMISPAGLLKISSQSLYDKRQYQLAGAQAVLIEGAALEAAVPANGAAHHAPRLQIRFNPALQLEGFVTITLQLLSADDVGSWVRALSRCPLLLRSSRLNTNLTQALIPTRMKPAVGVPVCT